MKKTNKKAKFLGGVLFFSLFLGIGIVSAKLVFGICSSVEVGKTYTTSEFTATSDDAFVELTPSKFSGSYSKKTLMSISVKSGNKYIVAYQDTKTLGYACYSYSIKDIGAGTWKLSLKQSNAAGTVKYAGMSFELGISA